MKIKATFIKVCRADFIANAVLHYVSFLMFKAVVVYPGGGLFSLWVYTEVTKWFFPFLLLCRRRTSNHLRSLPIAPSMWRRTTHPGNTPPCQFCVSTSRWGSRQTAPPCSVLSVRPLGCDSVGGEGRPAAQCRYL